MSGDDGKVTLPQIVAALSESYTDEGVLIWLNSMHAMCGSDPERLAHLVRRIGDADPSDFTVPERRPVQSDGSQT